MYSREPWSSYQPHILCIQFRRLTGQNKGKCYYIFMSYDHECFSSTKIFIWQRKINKWGQLEMEQFNYATWGWVSLPCLELDLLSVCFFVKIHVGSNLELTKSTNRSSTRVLDYDHWLKQTKLYVIREINLIRTKMAQFAWMTFL